MFDQVVSRKIIAFTLGASFLSACSPSAPQIPAPYDSTAEKLPPVSLEVATSEVKGDELTVTLLLKAKTQIESDNVIVGVKGLRDSIVVTDDVRQISKVTGKPLLKEGDEVTLDYTFDATKVTDYQVSCSWGEEARRVLNAGVKTNVAAVSPKIEPAPIPPPEVIAAAAVPETESRGKLAAVTGDVLPTSQEVALDQVNVESTSSDCKKAPCDLLFTVSADLVNGSSQKISNISLALGLVWYDLSAFPTLPAARAPLEPSEEEIKLSGVVLESGGKKRLKIKVDKAVPVVPGGEFRPNLRILSFESN